MPGRPLTVRPFAPGEATRLRTIRREALATDPQAFSSSLVEEWDMADDELEAWIEDSLIIGAFSGQEAVGMAGLRRLSRHKVSHRAELWGVYLRPDWRGSGMLDRMLDVMVEVCDRGIRQFELNVVSSSPVALAAYRRNGFRETGRIPQAALADGRFVDEIIMIRRLDGDA